MNRQHLSRDRASQGAEGAVWMPREKVTALGVRSSCAWSRVERTEEPEAAGRSTQGREHVSRGLCLILKLLLNIHHQYIPGIYAPEVYYY